MGASMFAGIVSIMEIATSINQSNINSQLPTNTYIGSNEQSADLVFLNTFSSADKSWGENKAFCEKLKEETLQAGFSSIAAPYDISEDSPSLHPKISKPCVLMKENHRIIISTDISKAIPYRYYSCILDSEAYCSFESNTDF